jgi:hypothetical protein
MKGFLLVCYVIIGKFNILILLKALGIVILVLMVFISSSFLQYLKIFFPLSLDIIKSNSALLFIFIIIKQAIFDFRFLALLAVVGSLAGSLLCFLNVISITLHPLKCCEILKHKSCIIWKNL